MLQLQSRLLVLWSYSTVAKIQSRLLLILVHADFYQFFVIKRQVQPFRLLVCLFAEHDGGRRSWTSPEARHTRSRLSLGQKPLLGQSSLVWTRGVFWIGLSIQRCLTFPSGKSEVCNRDLRGQTECWSEVSHLLLRRGMSEMYRERGTKYEENRRCDELQKMWWVAEDVEVTRTKKCYAECKWTSEIRLA